MIHSDRLSHFPNIHCKLIIAISVVVFHIAALWALQTGLLQRTVEVFVPAEILSAWIEPPEPKVDPPAPTSPATLRHALAVAPAKVQTITPQPLDISDAPPLPSAPDGVPTATPLAPPATAPLAPAAAAPERVELPSSDADYLKNPTPPYPPLSKRLGEQGKVVLHVLIGVDGAAQYAEIKQSSGFDRLDQSALSTVLRWRYVPGKRAGVPQAMWFNVPINYVLD